MPLFHVVTKKKKQKKNREVKGKEDVNYLKATRFAAGSGAGAGVKMWGSMRDLLEAVSLSGHVLQVLLQGLAELAQLLLGDHHLLANQQQGLQRHR